MNEATQEEVERAITELEREDESDDIVVADDSV